MSRYSRSVSGYPATETWTQRAESARGEREQEGLQEHADADGVDVAELPVHAHHADQRGAEELPVAQYRNASGLGVVA